MTRAMKALYMTTIIFSFLLLFLFFLSHFTVVINSKHPLYVHIWEYDNLIRSKKKINLHVFFLFPFWVMFRWWRRKYALCIDIMHVPRLYLFTWHRYSLKRKRRCIFRHFISILKYVDSRSECYSARSTFWCGIKIWSIPLEW
jgi:hypothetical protein